MPKVKQQNGLFGPRLITILNDDDKAMKKLGKYLRLDLMKKNKDVPHLLIKNEQIDEIEFFYKGNKFCIEFRNKIFLFVYVDDGQYAMIGVIPNKCKWRAKAYIMATVIKNHG